MLVHGADQLTQHIRNGKEAVLLVSPDNSFRPVLIDAYTWTHSILEREHLSKDHVNEKLWLWNGERALTGQRVFREPPEPTIAEPSENPLFDELVIKTPLPFMAKPQ